MHHSINVVLIMMPQSAITFAPIEPTMPEMSKRRQMNSLPGSHSAFQLVQQLTPIQKWTTAGYPVIGCDHPAASFEHRLTRPG